MEQLEKDILKAIQAIEKRPNGFAEMTSYSEIYRNTTENIKLYMPLLQGDYKKTLLPTASGDHQLEAILSGIDDITCFDINRLARYFTELKFGAIKNLTRKEYISFMYNYKPNKEIFDYFKNNLEEDILIFWEELYKKYNINILFRYLGINDGNRGIRGIEFSKYCVDNFCSYLQDDNYRIIQDKLPNINIKYIISDLLELPNVLEDNYDLINLTNIYEYINNDIVNGGLNKFVAAINKLIPYLNENGKMLITYLYKCSLNDFKKYGNKGNAYFHFLCMIENSMLGYYHDMISEKTVMDKLYAFRNAQLQKYIRNLNVDLHELPASGLGCGSGDKDMVLIYKK